MYRLKRQRLAAALRIAILLALLYAAPSLRAQNAPAPVTGPPPDTKPANTKPMNTKPQAERSDSGKTVAASVPLAKRTQARLPIPRPLPDWPPLKQLQYRPRLIGRGLDRYRSAPQSPEPAANAAEAAPPPSRALPSPLDSPPFPASDWVVPVIGAPDSTPDYPLQKALFGDKIKKSRLKVYGWIDAGLTLSNSRNSLSPYSCNVHKAI